jgi:hypothetical protein
MKGKNNMLFPCPVHSIFFRWTLQKKCRTHFIRVSMSDTATRASHLTKNQINLKTYPSRLP